MDVYKLTNQNHMTRNNTQWGPNVTHETDGNTIDLCNNHWLHYYFDPHLAILLNPTHGHIRSPRLYKARAEGKTLCLHQIKGGCTKLTTTEEIEPPQISLAQRRRFSIKIALLAEKNEWVRQYLQQALQAPDKLDQIYPFKFLKNHVSQLVVAGLYAETHRRSRGKNDLHPFFSVYQPKTNIHTYYYSAAITATLNYPYFDAFDFIGFTQDFFATK